MLKNKKLVLFLTIIYFSLFLNTGHLCFCKNIDSKTGVCDCCCHDENSTQTNDCDCCLTIKSDATKIAAESLFKINFLPNTTSFVSTEDIFNNLTSSNSLKESEQSHAPFRQRLDILKTVILLN